MADYKRSPLMSAVKANSRFIVGDIATHNKFFEIEKEQRNQFLRDALNLANQLEFRAVSLLLESLIAADEEGDEDDDDQE